MSITAFILYVLLLATIALAILAVRAEPAGAASSPVLEQTTECEEHPRLCYWRRLDGDFHKSLRAATRFWGVSYDWLHACAHSEGGHGPAFVWGSDGAGSYGPYQFLAGTFTWMSNQAWKDTRRRGLRIPIGYKRRDSMVGQTWTAAWAFSHGLSHHWFGKSCS